MVVSSPLCSSLKQVSQKACLTLIGLTQLMFMLLTLKIHRLVTTQSFETPSALCFADKGKVVHNEAIRIWRDDDAES